MKAITLFLFLLGGCLGIGATGEIVLALHPGVLPAEATEIPFMAAHQTSWALRMWVLGSNVANLVCAITLIRAGIAIRRGQPRGWRQLRGASGTLAAIAVVGIAVCLRFLLPLPTGSMAGPSCFMLASVVASGVGLTTVCLALFRYARMRRAG